MARQDGFSASYKSIVGAALVGLGLIVLFGKLDGSAAEPTNLLGTFTRETLGLLPCFVPAAWQALQVLAFDHQWFSPCAIQMLLSFGPPLLAMAGAI